MPPKAKKETSKKQQQEKTKKVVEVSKEFVLEHLETCM